MSKAEALDFLTEEEAKVQLEADNEAREEALKAEKGAPDAQKAAADAKAAEDAARAAADEAARVAAENVAKPATTAAVPATAEREPAPSFIPVVVAEAPADFDARMKAIADENAALPKKYEDGELTLAEFQAKLNALSDEKHELQSQQREAENAAKTNEANAQQVWKQTVDMYKDQNPDLKNPVLAAAWDASLKEVLKAEGNDDKSMYWFLKEAHTAMRKTLGMDKSAPGEAPANPAASATPPARPAPAAPPSLHGLPNTTRADTGKDEFADLDSLSGLEAEMALDRMAKTDPQKYDRYLRNQ